jgi:hypothetical protein
MLTGRGKLELDRREPSMGIAPCLSFTAAPEQEHDPCAAPNVYSLLAFDGTKYWDGTRRVCWSAPAVNAVGMP